MKSSRQKLLTLIVAAALAIGVFQAPVSVYAEGTASEDMIQPRYSHLNQLSTSFNIIKSNGNAVAHIIISFYSNTDSAKIKVEFQRLYEGEWSTIVTSIADRYSSPADYETSTYVLPGYYYRAVVTVDLYENGNVAETVSSTSEAVYY